MKVEAKSMKPNIVIELTAEEAWLLHGITAIASVARLSCGRTRGFSDEASDLSHKLHHQLNEFYSSIKP